MKNLLLLIVFLILSCSRGVQVYDTSFIEMDTLTRLKVVCESKQQARLVFDSITAEAKRMRNLFSEYDSGSALFLINARAQNETAFTIHPEVARLIARALAIGRETNGIYDCTLFPLKRLWGFGTGLTPHIPAQSQIDSVLPWVSYISVTMDTLSNLLVLARKGIQFDLGGIAKGYALTRFAGIAEQYGVKNYLIEAGGDIFIKGSKPGNTPWTVGLQHPRNPEKMTAVFAPVPPVSVVTSGDYERFFIEGNRRYHHLFNPSAGSPATGCVSVTIITGDPVLADAFSTSVFVMGPQKD